MSFDTPSVEEEALRFWRANTIGTATTPPEGFLTQYGLLKAINQLSDRIEELEGRIAELENKSGSRGSVADPR